MGGRNTRGRREEDPEERSRPTKIAFPKNKGEKISLKRNEVIELTENGEKLVATVLSREKVTGAYYNYFNIQGEDGLRRNVNLEKVAFRKLEESDCNMVMIPASRHGDPDCRMALQTELEKLKQFDAYETVDDVGQYRISSTAIYWYKGQEVRARLVARGFEETAEVPSDSPTVDKSTLRILLAVCEAAGWILGTSEVKSVFFAGCQLDREVIMKPQ